MASFDVLTALALVEIFTAESGLNVTQSKLIWVM
jgi:hypothetical protein